MICRNESHSLITQPPVPFLKYSVVTNAFRISLLVFPAFIIPRYMLINPIQKTEVNVKVASAVYVMAEWLYGSTYSSLPQ
jgi:hypothetical protein